MLNSLFKRRREKKGGGGGLSKNHCRDGKKGGSSPSLLPCLGGEKRLPWGIYLLSQKRKEKGPKTSSSIHLSKRENSVRSFSIPHVSERKKSGSRIYHSRLRKKKGRVSHFSKETDAPCPSDKRKKGERKIVGASSLREGEGKDPF